MDVRHVNHQWQARHVSSTPLSGTSSLTHIFPVSLELFEYTCLESLPDWKRSHRSATWASQQTLPVSTVFLESAKINLFQPRWWHCQSTAGMWHPTRPLGHPLNLSRRYSQDSAAGHEQQLNSGYLIIDCTPIHFGVEYPFCSRLIWPLFLRSTLWPLLLTWNIGQHPPL